MQLCVLLPFDLLLFWFITIVLFHCKVAGGTGTTSMYSNLITCC